MLVVAGSQVAGAGASPSDLFTGAWQGTGGPGSTLRIQIGAPNASGERQVHFTEQGGENAPAGVTCVAHGSGLVESNPGSGFDIFTGTWTMRCRGEVSEGGFGLIRPYLFDGMIYGSDSLQRVGGS